MIKKFLNELKKIKYMLYDIKFINLFFMIIISLVFLSGIYMFKKANENIKANNIKNIEKIFSNNGNSKNNFKKKIILTEDKIFEEVYKNYFVFIGIVYFILFVNFYIISTLSKNKNYDELTGLLKRNYLRKKFELLKLLNEKIAVVFVDLDNFKIINDTAGHEIGDEVLIEISQRLKNAVKGKELVARIGGDEFIILYPYKKEEELEQFLHSLKEEVKLKKKFKDFNYKISASIGVVLYPDHADNINELIKKADIAMYETKKTTKDGISYYTSDIERKTKHKLKIKNSLEEILFSKKLKEDYGLEVFLQPQINKKGILKGAEALIRWKYSEGLPHLSPADFLGVAYESGLIYYIDLFVMEEIAKKMSEWLKKGYNPGIISVNLTLVNLENNNFINEILNIIKKYNIPINKIGLEITEESLMKKPEKNIKLINQLKDLGFVLSIDDFGTGYSGLEYLKKFKIDKLKIDRIFIKDLPNYKDEVILKAITVLTNGFNLETIAEGVETEEQKEIVFNLGIDYIQGYYFDKPLPFDEFEKKYLKYNC